MLGHTIFSDQLDVYLKMLNVHGVDSLEDV